MVIVKNVFDIIRSICFIRLNPQKMFSTEQLHSLSHRMYTIHLSKRALSSLSHNKHSAVVRRRNLESELSEKLLTKKGNLLSVTYKDKKCGEIKL